MIEKEKIETTLKMLGIRQQLKGYDYIVDGIMFLDENNDINMSNDLYPFISKKYNVKERNVERNIRTIVDDIANYGNKETLSKIFGYNIKMTPKRFVFGVHKYLREKD